MKNLKLKRLLALMMAVIMVIGLFTACGKTTEAPVDEPAAETEKVEASGETKEEPAELEPVTLKWYYDGSDMTEMEGTADVIEAFNAKLAEVLPNTTVEFTFVSDYEINWPLLLAGGEKMDIAWAGWKTNFLQDVVDGNLLPLTDLVEEYAPILKEESEIWQIPYGTAVYEGELWGIPGVQPVINEAQFMKFGEQFIEYMDVEAVVEEFRSNSKLTPKVLDLIEEGIEAAIADGLFEVGATTWKVPVSWEMGLKGYMMLGAESNNFWFDPEAENPEALYMLEVPEVKMVLERFSQWYDKGWFTDAQMLGQMPENAMFAVEFQKNYIGKWNNSDELGIEFIEVPSNTAKNYYKVLTNTPEENYVGMNNFGSENTYLVIPYTAENPERAIMLLDILRGEEGTVGYELMNMLCYGFEKNSPEAEKYGWFNYEAVDVDGQLTVDTSARGDAPDKHSMFNWVLGNTFKCMHDGGALTTTSSKEYAMNYLTNVYPNLPKTKVAGMVANYDAVSFEMSELATRYSEYKNTLTYGCGGSANFEATYEEAMSKLNDAGLGAIKEELNAQIAAYIAK